METVLSRRAFVFAGLAAAGAGLVGLKGSRVAAAANPTIQTVVITVLSDAFFPPQIRESGLCLHVAVIAKDASRHNFMFECGASGPELHAGVFRSGVRLSNVEAYVMGGWQGERTAGFIETLSAAPAISLGPKMLWPNVGSHLQNARCEIVPGAYLTPSIPTPQMVLDTGEPIRTAERAVYINLHDKGLVIISGCSRAGMPAAIKAAIACSGVSKVHAVVGGFHLKHADIGSIDETISQVKAFSPSYLVPMHCTGTEAVNRLRVRLPECFPIHPVAGYSVERRIMFA